MADRQLSGWRGHFHPQPVRISAPRVVRLARGGVRCLQTRRPGAQVLCCLFTVIATGLFVLSLSLLPLAEATAATFTSPIFVTILAVPLLGERVGLRRWSAVVIGFAGVLLMLRPTGAAVQWAILIPVCAAFSGSLRDIVTRKLTVDVSTIAILFSAYP